jgi:hypothetical protein
MGREIRYFGFAALFLLLNLTAVNAVNNEGNGEALPVILTDPAIADHDIGNVAYTVSNFGQYGLALTAINTLWNGEGFKMPLNGTNFLFEGALFIGDGPTRVSNGARDENQNFGDDFVAFSDIVLSEPGPFADQEYHTSYNDSNAMNPLGITVEQESYAFSSEPDNDYIITEYTITNNGNTALTGVLVAHFEDWDMPWNVADDMVNFDRSRNLGYQYNGNDYRGQQVLSDQGVFSFMALDNALHVYPPMFTLSDKWSYMNAGIVDTAITVQIDCSMIITTGPYDIDPGQSVVAAFAILGGNGLADLQVNADAAMARYNATSIDDVTDNLPEIFELSQNYPNPFNASTTISFSLSEQQDVTLTVYDLLGRKIVKLIENEKRAGSQQVTFNASDLSSGVYFYRLQAGDKEETRRMVLLK